MLVTPPIVEPFTLPEAKLRAGLDWPPGDPRDALMTSFMQAARSQVEQDTGIAFFTQTHSVPLESGIGRPLRLPWRPVQSVVVHVIEPAAVWDASQYLLDPSSVEARPATLRLVANGCWPAGLRATIVVGCLTVLELQQQAPGLLFAVGLLLAHYATAGRDLTTVGPIARTLAGYDEAIAPYQLVSVG